MYNHRSLNWNASALFAFLALILQFLFLIFLCPEYHAISMAHGNVALNIYRYNQPAINNKLAQHMAALQHGKPALIDFAAVKDIDFGSPGQPFPVNDTIGYGVLLGILWKLTDSLSFRDIIALQMLMYCLMVMLLWYVAFWLFNATHVANYVCIAFLAYLPLIALNTTAVRDVWAAYGVMVLLYALTGYLHNKISVYATVGWLSAVALCMWIRPSLFLATITATGVLGVIAFMHKAYRRSTINDSFS